MENIKKTKYGYEYDYKGLNVVITTDEINDELIHYGNKVVDYYFENKDKVIEFLFQKFERDNWYIDKYTKEEIIEKIGEPTIHVDDVNFGNIVYLDSMLDEHIITVELYKLDLSHVCIDG